MTDDIEAEGERFLAEFAKAEPAERTALCRKGQDLARRIRSATIDLCYNKATESSPRIPSLFLLAAKLAYLSFGAGARELEPFERDIYYYADYKPPNPIVTAYDAFKRAVS